MNKEIIDNIFNEVGDKYLEYLNSEDFEKNFEDIKSQGVSQAIGKFCVIARNDAVDIMRAVLIKLLNSEDFKRELYKDMMQLVEEERRRTGKERFD